MMWVWQGSRVNSWLAGCLAGGWLMWCCCLVVETGTDADFIQCPNVQCKYPMVVQCQMSNVQCQTKCAMLLQWYSSVDPGFPVGEPTSQCGYIS